MVALGVIVVVMCESPSLRRGLQLHQTVWSYGEEFLDIRDDLDKAVDLQLRVVEVEAGAGGGGHSQFLHQGLIAMMSAAKGDTALVRDGNDIMRVHAINQKAHEAGAANV